MATTTTTTERSLHHATHEHPLEKVNFDLDQTDWSCRLCQRKILAEAYYACQERRQAYYNRQEICQDCSFAYHIACVEAPPQIDRHPLHPTHPLNLIHHRPSFVCDACGEVFKINGSSFSCVECDFDLDVCCALSTLSDRGGSPGGTIPEQVAFPFHPHPLTSFSRSHDFAHGGNCMICRGGVGGKGYMCLRRRCQFLIHKRCIEDLYYVGGSDAPRVYHDHPLETFVGGEDKGSSRCTSCGSDDASGEFIGCASCRVFYHRDCIQAPLMIQYPPHPDHSLSLFINTLDEDKTQCPSCLNFVEVELCYRCISCEYSVHVGCSLKVLSYCKEGMSAEIDLSSHVHPLTLCHRNETVLHRCTNCWNQLTGPAYVCQTFDCVYQIHGKCTESESGVNHPYHPDHPLSLVSRDDEDFHHGEDFPCCEACRGDISDFDYSCNECPFHLDKWCAARMPSQKHYLHQHELLYFDELSELKCNRCDTLTDSPLFRCVPCNFNLHEKCMELPPVVKHKTHVHPLTLREFFREDDSGEYYCDLCEERRDGRLGVYVCGDCERKMDRPWAFHIECILPELRKVYENPNAAAMDRIAEEILRREEELREAEEELREVEEKVEEKKRALEGLRKKQAAMTMAFQ